MLKHMIIVAQVENHQVGKQIYLLDRKLANISKHTVSYHKLVAIPEQVRMC